VSVQLLQSGLVNRSAILYRDDRRAVLSAMKADVTRFLRNRRIHIVKVCRLWTTRFGDLALSQERADGKLLLNQRKLYASISSGRT
jgi:hypothetical protein